MSSLCSVPRYMYTIPLGLIGVVQRRFGVFRDSEHRSKGQAEVVQRSEPCDDLVIVEPGRRSRDRHRLERLTMVLHEIQPVIDS